MLRPLLLVALTAGLPASQSQAAAPQGPDERAVLATIERFFAAVHDKDRRAIEELVLPDGLATAIRLDSGPRMRSWHWRTYIENTLGAPDRWTERLIEPLVRVNRDVAVVWGRYEMTAGDKFSHCGTDHFDLVRQDGAWRIYNLTWTNQTKDCPGR
jgi:hypothetical protein